MKNLINYNIRINVMGKDAEWNEIQRKTFLGERYFLLEAEDHRENLIILKDDGNFKAEYLMTVKNGFLDEEWFEYANDMKEQYYKKNQKDADF